MAMLIMEAIGPRGEELALAAADAQGIAVGWDSEFNSATFDTDATSDEELEAQIVAELERREPDWRAHLRAVD
jgi:hypothetical protein